MGLRTLHKALAPKTARTNGDHALNDVKPTPQRVTPGVKQGAHALLLVVTQARPAHALGAQLSLKHPQQHQASQTEQQGRGQQAPAQAGKKNNRQTSRQHQYSGAKIGLPEDQPYWQQQQADRHHKVKRTQLALALLEPPGQHQRHGDLQDFTGLNHQAQIEPALRTLFGQPEQRHGHQQANAQHIQRQGQVHQTLWRHLRHAKQNQPGNQHVASMVLKTGAMVVARGIHGQQACQGQQACRGRQWHIKTPKPGRDALP